MFRLIAVALAMAAISPVICSAATVSVTLALTSGPPRSDCHQHSPAPVAPHPAKRCCMAGRVAKAALSARYEPSFTFFASWMQTSAPMLSARDDSNPGITSPHSQAPPGHRILRI